MRLFVALNFPAPVRERVWRAASPLREANLPVRWVGADRLHLTLQFLGRVEEHRLADLEAALRAVGAEAEPFELRLDGVGAFPSLARPRVVWLGVEAPPALGRLQAEVVRETAGLGFQPEERPFHSHITLGRTRRGANHDRFRGLEEIAGRVELDARCRSESLELMESVLAPQGARYSVVSSFPLEGKG